MICGGHLLLAISRRHLAFTSPKLCSFFLSRGPVSSVPCSVFSSALRAAPSPSPPPPPPQSALCSRWTPAPKPRHPRAHRPPRRRFHMHARAAVAFPLLPGRPSLTITLFRYPKSLWYCLPLRLRWRHEDPCFPLHESYLHIYKGSRGRTGEEALFPREIV